MEIKLTDRRHRLGWLDKYVLVDGETLFTHDYSMGNILSISRSEKEKQLAILNDNYYHTYAHIETPYRKRKVFVCIKFGKDGGQADAFVRSSIPQKEKKILIEKVKEWLVEDGWAIKVSD